MIDNPSDESKSQTVGSAIKEEFIRSLRPTPIEVVRSTQLGLIGFFSILMGCLGLFFGTMCIMNDHDFAGAALGTASVAGAVYIVVSCLKIKQNDLR